MANLRFSTRNYQGIKSRLNTRQMPQFFGPTALNPPVNVEYYVVGGGGGGNQGGGGAGGVSSGTFIINQSPTSPNVRLTITVGAGGGGAASGSNTTISSPTYTVYGVGGGAGATRGGSGGGAFRDTPGSQQPGFPGQGNAGGNCPGTQHGGAGGGGGAGGVGSNGAAGGASSAGERGGAGGIGTTNNWIGPTVGYAAGGGGASQNDDQNVAGPTGSHGAGISTNLGQGGICPNGDRVGGRAGGPVSPSISGNVNTGGGGGGDQTGPNGGGGSGVAIVRFPTSNYITEIAGSNVQTFSSGGFTVYKFNAPGSINFGPPAAYGG